MHIWKSEDSLRESFCVHSLRSRQQLQVMLVASTFYQLSNRHAKKAPHFKRSYFMPRSKVSCTHTHMLNLTLETNDAKLYTCSSVDCSSDSSLQMESNLEFYAHSPSVSLKLSILHLGNRDKQLAG